MRPLKAALALRVVGGGGAHGEVEPLRLRELLQLPHAEAEVLELAPLIRDQHARHAAAARPAEEPLQGGGRMALCQGLLRAFVQGRMNRCAHR